MASSAALRRIAVLAWIVAGLLVVGFAWRLAFAPRPEPGRFAFPAVPSSRVAEAPDGHAYQYVAAPNIRWDKARAAAVRHSWQGHKGYLATIDSAAEFQFVLSNVFPDDTDVTYLGDQPWPFPSSLMLGFRARALGTDLTLQAEEIEDARWFTRDELVAAIGDGSVVVSGRISISRRIIEHWFGGPLDAPEVPLR